MKKIMLMFLSVILSGCATEEPKTYPYGITEEEWNELSIKDKATIRRDFYFVEKGQMGLINPELNIEGKDGNSSTENDTKGQSQFQPQSPSNYVSDPDVPEISFEPQQNYQPERLIH